MTVRSGCLRGKSKRDVSNIEVQITRQILADRKSAKMSRGVVGSDPIPWSFRPLRSDEPDDFRPTTPIRVRVADPWRFDDPFGTMEGNTEAKAGFTTALEGALQNAAGKFEEYPDCLRILLCNFTAMTPLRWTRT